jgi:transposase
MIEKETYKMRELVKMFGVHRNTIINKTKKYAELWKRGKYKTVYTREEVELIKKELAA